MTITLQTPVTATTPAVRSGSPGSARTPQPIRARWRVLTSHDRGAGLAAWRIVEARFTGAGRHVPLAASFDWTSAWLQHYGAVVAHEFLVLDDDHGPCGVALLTRAAGRGIGPWREQTRHLGTAGEPAGECVCVEHNHLLVLPERRAVFQEQLIAHALRDKSWEALCLDGFTVAEFDALQSELPGFEPRYRDAPYYDLRAARNAGGDLWDCLGRSTRQNLRRLLRKYGEVELLWAESRDQAFEVFEELQTLHQARWQKAGQPGAFHSRRFRDFQRTLIQQTFTDGRSAHPAHGVVLFRVRQQGATVGCLMLLIDGPRLLDYLSGFGDFETFASPGLVTHALCMTAALHRGFDEYDFLVGEKRHKDNLSTNSNQLVWACWRRPTLRSRTIGMLSAVKRRWLDLRHPATPAQSASAGT